MVALLNASRLAFRQSFFIRPGSWIESCGIDHELIAFPFADGVAVPREVRIFGKLSSIRPDFAPDSGRILRVMRRCRGRRVAPASLSKGRGSHEHEGEHESIGHMESSAAYSL